MDLHSDLSDDDLLHLYAAGDGRATELLTVRLLPRVYAHAVRLLGDTAEAEDVAQESMIRLWRIAPDWQFGNARITTWLYQVTANLCTDRLRRRRGTSIDDVPEPQDSTPSAVARMQERTRGNALQAALATLPERQRQAVVLRHIEGLSNPDIADIMDITPRAVESLTARGKRALSDLLRARRAELGYEDDAD